jgi:phosphocarrier protein
MSREVTIQNKLGLHARPATEFVKKAMRFSCDITIAKDGHVSDGKSVIGILMLAAGPGTTLEITAQGADAAACLHLTAPY